MIQSYIDMLGKTGRDRVTGLTGVVTSVSFDLFGCICAVLSPPTDKDGKRVDGAWLDVHRIEITNHEHVMQVPQFAAPVKFGATPQTHTHGPAEKPER